MAFSEGMCGAGPMVVQPNRGAESSRYLELEKGGERRGGLASSLSELVLRVGRALLAGWGHTRALVARVRRDPCAAPARSWSRIVRCLLTGLRTVIGSVN